MEEDYAHLVGLGLGMWLFLIAFVLLSTVLGAPAAAKPPSAQQPVMLAWRVVQTSWGSTVQAEQAYQSLHLHNLLAFMQLIERLMGGAFAPALISRA